MPQLLITADGWSHWLVMCVACVTSVCHCLMALVYYGALMDLGIYLATNCRAPRSLEVSGKRISSCAQCSSAPSSPPDRPQPVGLPLPAAPGLDLLPPVWGSLWKAGCVQLTDA